LSPFIAALMLRLIVFFVLFPLIAIAQLPDPKPDTYVNDYTHNLTADQIRSLDEQLFQLEQQTTVQMAILLIRDLPEDMRIEDYARAIGNKWKVGKAYNGLVYVAVLNDRRQRLEVARNLEGEIPDITAFEIIENLKPYLRKQDYYGALALLISQVSDQVGGKTAQPAQSTPQTIVPQEQSGEPVETRRELSEYEKEKAKWDHYGTYALWFLLAGAIGFSIWAWRYKRKYVREHTINGVYIGIGSSYLTSTYGSESSDSGGGSSGFGGFGGGGGGGFSGGGASGSW